MPEGSVRSRSALRFSLALAAATATLLPAVTAAAQDEDWSIERSTAPGSVLAYEATEGTLISVDVAPDGRTIVFDLLGHLYEMPIQGGTATALTEGRSWNMFPRYSPDGTRIAFTSDRGGSDDLWVLNRGTGELTNVSNSPGPVARPSWSADGRHVYGSARDPASEFDALQFNFHGTHQVLIHSGNGPLNVFIEDTLRDRILFEHADQPLYPFGFDPFRTVPSGTRIKAYDLETGEVTSYIERPGGAANPAISPDGRWLAYVHRDGAETVLVLHDLSTREEQVLLRGLDRDRQESRFYPYGTYPGFDFGPEGQELFLAVGGHIRRVDVESGDIREAPFRAPVRRELDRTIRFPVEIPTGRIRTRSHRFAHRTDRGIVFEALGDLYLRTPGGTTRNLTETPEHETSSAYDPASGTLYYAAWSDEDLGAVYARPIDGGDPTRLTTFASQYGALTVAPDGRSIAYVRGTGELQNGLRLMHQLDFELVVRGADGTERVVTEISARELGYGNFAARRPPSITFGPDGDHIYFTEFENDTLMLKRIELDGDSELTLYGFPHAVRAVIAPDLRWIAFREYRRNYITPFEYVGKPVIVSGEDGQGVAKRVDAENDGPFLSWSTDGAVLSWTRGGGFFEKSVDAILNDGDAERTEVSVEFEVATPRTTIALTGVRVVTMNRRREVLENATVLIRNAEIAAVGTDVTVPSDARVYELSGHTVIPGIVDAHAHPNPDVSPLNVIEQRPADLHAPLAYGVTTTYEVYGTTQRDPWVEDMIRAGRLIGPRHFTVGPPAFGLRDWRPRLWRDLETLDDAREQVRYNRDQGATALKDYVNFTRKRRHLLATAAREEGMNVVSESAANPPMNLTQIIDGVTGIEHSMGLTPIYEDIVRIFQASDVGITPTLGVVYNGPGGESYFHQSERLWEDEKLLRFTTREDLMRVRRPTHYWPEDLYAPEMAASMKKLYAAGVLVNLGAHGQMLGLDAHWEMELFAQGGFEPDEILEVATINGAVYHGLDRQVGSIEPGKLADLVILEANPLEDIRNARSILYVMKHGVLYSGEDASRVYPDPQPMGPYYFERARLDR